MILYVVLRFLFMALGACLILPFWLFWQIIKGLVNIVRWCFR